VDYKFVFKREEGEITWAIRSGSEIQPKEIDDYLNILISLHSEVVSIEKIKA